MKKSDNKGTAGISYPCLWLYKVIGTDRKKLQAVLQESAGSRSCTVSSSRSSSGEKYHCFNLEVTVASEEERNEIYQTIKSHPDVTVVL
jgi:putative lipoic acid-binding regulatory protein